MGLIVKRSEENPELPKVYAFDTFFLPAYPVNGYDAVCRWIGDVDVQAQDLLFFPVHKDDHWALALVDVRSKEINHMDSLGRENQECLEMLLDYVAQELERRAR